MTEQIKTSITGYGLVFKRVMKDTNLNIEAKALYAYLSSYAGSSGTAFPSVSLICHELNISEKRFKKYRKQLEYYGYLSVKRNRTDNGFSKNIYTIEHNPVSGSFVPVQIVPGQSVTGRFVTEQNVGTTINSITNNNITNNRDKNNSSSKQQSPFDFYQKNGFGVLNAHVHDEMEMYLDSFEYNSNEIIIASMKIAIDRNKISWGYTKGILKTWIDAKLNSIEDVRAYEKKLKLIQSNNFKKNSVEKIPQWLIDQKSNNKNNRPIINSVDFEQRKKELEQEIENFWKEDNK